jgi:hypothetical protein
MPIIILNLDTHEARERNACFQDVGESCCGHEIRRLPADGRGASGFQYIVPLAVHAIIQASRSVHRFVITHF